MIDTTATDPAAIDLEPYKEFTTQTTSKLIAAVEALRERLKDWRDPNDWSSLCRNRDAWMQDCKAAEAKVRTFSDHRAGVLETLEAAETRVAELTGALEGLFSAICNEDQSRRQLTLRHSPPDLPQVIERARTALAATPATRAGKK